MARTPSNQVLLRSILKQVSRSFYLTLAVLPRSVRDQVGLAYLFARAADTIADTGQLDPKNRLDCLGRLKAQFVKGNVNSQDISTIRTLVAPNQPNPHERLLIEELEQCFSLYQQLNPQDQTRIANLLPTLIEGMEFDQVRFQEQAKGEVYALPTMNDLDYYTYAVAGCVGAFWTKMMCAHLSNLSSWDQEVMVPIGIRYGKGLQLVNILRDLPRDLQKGRCYVPLSLLHEVGLQPKELLNLERFPIFRPIFHRLILIARDHLDQGWQYTMAIPRLEIRLRLACMWPILIGMRTLNLLAGSSNALDPTRPLKVSRPEVYRIMAATTLSGGCGYVGTAYWGYLRKRVV
ncbi:MAG: phytoene/squalene synthase family protein [Nitrospirales bacterium]|nr:phytoene/squalene synthase family protein [Nitrospirales bacterium]